MARGTTIVAVTMLALVMAGCGSVSGSGSTTASTAGGGNAPAKPVRRPSPGVGVRAPISRVLVTRRYRSWRGRPIGSETVGAMGCGVRVVADAEIGIYTDTPEPSCVWVTGNGTVLVVNRTGAYHRREGESLLVRLGPYEARLLPQQAVRFGPVGRFLGGGITSSSRATADLASWSSLPTAGFLAKEIVASGRRLLDADG